MNQILRYNHQLAVSSQYFSCSLVFHARETYELAKWQAWYIDVACLDSSDRIVTHDEQWIVDQ